VQHTTNTLVAEIRTTAEALGERKGVSLAAFPAGHIAGVLGLLRMVLLGTPTVLMDQWDPSRAARLVEVHRVTTTAGPPFFLSGMLDAAEAEHRDVSSLRNYWSARPASHGRSSNVPMPLASPPTERTARARTRSSRRAAPRTGSTNGPAPTVRSHPATKSACSTRTITRSA